MLGVAGRRQLLTCAIRSTPKISILPSPFLTHTARCRLIKQTCTPSTLRAFSSLPSIRQQAAQAASDEIEPNGLPQELTTFSQLAEHGLVSPKVIDTIVNRMNIHTMTDIQRLTFTECLDGADVIAQAKTGTGKTLAFLMPIVQRILRDPNLERRSSGYQSRASAGDIRALIISPTRELAEQIAVEAKKIVHNTAVKVQTAVGGTQKSMHLRLMQREGCHILVGTPGRIQDLLSDEYSGVSLDNIEAFVLDEADRLLDIGFAPAIEEIQSFMPPREKRARQTMMFSATVPKEVVSLVRKTLRPDFKFIRTVDPDEAPTHARVPQHVVFLNGLENQLPAILELATNSIAAHKADPENNMPFKAIVYFSSTAEVNLAYNVFENLRSPAAPGGSRMFTAHPLEPTRILEMHSKLSQNERTRNSQAFRNAKSAILFSSDVTARGMDFPNVSHVIQVGLPRSADDYIHRIGRTGRAGKLGEGWLMLQEDEEGGYKRYLARGALSIQENNSLKTAQLDMSQAAQLPQNVADVLNMIQAGVKATPRNVKATAYVGMLGVLGQGSGGVRSKQAIIDMLNGLAKYGWGMEKPPSLMTAGVIEKEEAVDEIGLVGLEVEEEEGGMISTPETHLEKRLSALVEVEVAGSERTEKETKAGSAADKVDSVIEEVRLAVEEETEAALAEEKVELATEEVGLAVEGAGLAVEEETEVALVEDKVDLETEEVVAVVSVVGRDGAVLSRDDFSWTQGLKGSPSFSSSSTSRQEDWTARGAIRAQPNPQWQLLLHHIRVRAAARNRSPTRYLRLRPR